MSKISYSLTKSKITTGLRCPKKLWFDINEKIEIDHFHFHKGNVFGNKIKEVYGNGFDLSHNFDENIVSTITKEVSRNLDNFFQIYQKLNEDEKLKYDEFMKKRWPNRYFFRSYNF